MRKIRLHLPIHYVVLVAVGLAVLFALLYLYGRNDRVLIGWAIGFLLISRVVDIVYRRRRRQRREPPPGA